MLQSALNYTPEEREAFLRRACAGDDALEREVRSLLTSAQQAGSFLENRALDVAASTEARAQAAGAPDFGDSLAGRKISHYQILGKLGAGGMGIVWKARDTRLDRYVALKLLPAATLSDPERKRRFVQEAKTASALNHPNIITIHEIDHSNVGDFIAMEFVPGKALDQSIPRKGLRLSDALTIAIQVADALAAAHAAGIVHRDLKPANIMVSESGRVKVLDFGLAKLSEPSNAGLTRDEASSAIARSEQGMIVGTVSYMSPEQAEGKKVDARSDIFSFGAMLYEMLTGRQAFTGDSMLSILTSILRDQPKPVAELAPAIPHDLDRIVARCLQKDLSLRYQHAGDLRIDLQDVRKALADSASHHEASPKLGARRWWLVAILACSALSFAVAWRLREPREADPLWNVTRLTNDEGLSDASALSHDGNLVAFSSNAAPDSEGDLYVKQVTGGQPIRLTFDGAGNTAPHFSPDGSRIVFRSNRNGGGIFLIPTFGGEIRLVARDGLDPRFSPDGSQVAYWIGSASIVASAPGSGAVWVVPVTGGQPRRVGANFTSARLPIWSPDGKHLLFVGYTSAKAFETSGIDWWLASTNGSEAVKTGMYDALVHSGLPSHYSNPASIPAPACWTGDDTVIFSLPSGDVGDLWEIGISPRTGKVNSAFKRLTTGSTNATSPSCASAGALTFTSGETRREIWAAPFDLNRGRPQGALERITSGPAFREHASLAADGRLAFASDQAGRGIANIWVRDLATGKESALASSSLVQRYPVINHSGDRIAYSVYEKDNKRALYVSAPGGAPEKLCEGCLRATDWSRDESHLLTFGGNPYQINLLDLASHQQSLLVKHPTDHLIYGRFSPDNTWISFTQRTQPNRALIVIAPIDGPTPVPENAWIQIAEADPGDWAVWSPDGKTLYYPSWKDGHSCLWGERIDAQTHRPSGEPFAALHLHGRASYQYSAGWSTAGGRIAMVLIENTGNIWMMSRSPVR